MKSTDSPKLGAVTGAASGIGQCVVQNLLADGWEVWALDSNAEGLQRLALSSGPKLHTLVCDVSRPDSVAQAFSNIGQCHSHLDALVCSAGVVRVGPLTAHAPEDLDFMMAVNIKGTWLSVKEAQPLLRANATMARPSRVIMMGSVTGMMPKAGSGFYGATKAATHAMAQVLAVELAAYGITVNAIAPGSVDTPMRHQVLQLTATSGYKTYGTSPMGRIAHVDDIAGAVMYLLSDAARYVSGAILPVDGASRAAFV